MRITRHGPLVSDAINANNAGVDAATRSRRRSSRWRFRWTALDDDDTTVAAFLQLNEARNWSEFTAALRDFVVPSQNFVYADVDGHIGYYAPGRIPIRASRRRLAAGRGLERRDRVDRLGSVRRAAARSTIRPEHSSSPRTTGRCRADYPHLIGLEWPEPYRAQRITDLLREGTRLTPDDFRDIQADTVSLHAKALLPLLLQHARPESDAERRALEMLRGVGRRRRRRQRRRGDLPGLVLRLAPAIAGDELGPASSTTTRGASRFVTRFVANTLTADDGAWCDDVTTPGPETLRARR